MSAFTTVVTANFALQLVNGVNTVALPATPPTEGPGGRGGLAVRGVDPEPNGQCEVAGFGEWFYVATTATNSWWRQIRYDASPAIAFVLAS